MINFENTELLFGQELGKKILAKRLVDIESFNVEVTGTVSKIIKKDLEFARGAEWVLGV